MRNAVVAGVVLCAVACSRDRAKQQEREAPAETSLEQRFAAKVREIAPTLRVEVAGELEVHIYAKPDSDVSSINHLDNLSRLCRDSPATCDEDIDRYARIAVQSAQSEWDVDAPVDPARVRAVLKDDIFMNQTRALLKEKSSDDAGAGFEIAARRFVGDLWIVYVEDSPDSMRLLNADHLSKLKLDAAELHALALKNLGDALPDIPYVTSDEMPNVWGVVTGDSYDAARMLLHERWKPIRDVVKGELVVAVPTRDFLVFSGTGHPEALDLVREIAEKAQQDAYALSARLYRWTPDGWVVHEPR